MNKHREIASPAFLTSRRFLLPCALAFLFAFGCDTDESVRHTVPTNGQEEVPQDSQILIQFSDSFDQEEDGDSVQDGITVVGSQNGEYRGTVEIMTFAEANARVGGAAAPPAAEEEIDPNQLINDILANPDQAPRTPGARPEGDGGGDDGGGDDGGEDDGGDGTDGTEPEEPEEPETDTLLWTLESGVVFQPGERIAVNVSHDITVGGSNVESYDFTFRVATEPPPVGFVVESTVPQDLEVVFGRNPRVAAVFSRPVDADSLAGNIEIHGEQSGKHIDLQLAAAESTTDGVLEVTSRLRPDDDFAPGEWVTVTMTEGIRVGAGAAGSSGGDDSADDSADDSGGDSTDDSADGADDSQDDSRGADESFLRPHGFRFQVAPGRVAGGWADSLRTPTANGASRMEIAELIQEFDGREIAVLGRDRLSIHFQTSPGSWDFVPLDFEDGAVAVDFVAGDLIGDAPFDGDGSPEAVVLFQGTETLELCVYGLDPFRSLVENWRLTLPMEFEEGGLRGLEIVDIDNSGDLDVLVFHAPGQYTTPPIDADSEPVSVPTTTLTILSKNAATPGGTTPGSTTPGRTTPRGAPPASGADAVAFTFVEIAGVPSRLETADLDGDGRLDLVVQTDSGLHLYRNEGRPSDRYRFELKKTLTEANGTVAAPATWGLGDVDSDGDVDIVAWSAGGQASLVRNNVFVPRPVNQGNPDENRVQRLPSPSGVLFAALTFTPFADLDLGAVAVGESAPFIGDADGDGAPDIILSDSNGGVHLFEGSEAAPLSFARETPVLVGSASMRQIVVADLNGNTGLDVATLVTGPATAGPSVPPSFFDTFLSVDVQAAGPPRSFEVLVCDDDDGESLFGPACAEQDVRLFENRSITVPLVGDIDQEFAGYDLVLKYNPDLLRFTRFELPQKIRSGSNRASVTICGAAANDDCDGFIHITVTLPTDGSTQVGIADGEDFFLGNVTFTARRVDEATDTEITLVSAVSEESGTVRTNGIVVADGDARLKLSAVGSGEPLRATVFPPLLRVDECEIVGVRARDFTARVRYNTQHEEFGADLTALFVLVNGVQTSAVAPCADEPVEECLEVLAVTSPADIELVGFFEFETSDGEVQQIESRGDCTAAVLGNILQPLVTCRELPDGSVRLSWELGTAVQEFVIVRNGDEDDRDTVSGDKREYIDHDPPRDIRLNYAVTGWIGSRHGPSGNCQIGPLNPIGPRDPIAPTKLTLTPLDPSGTSSPLGLELSWINNEGYDRLDLEIFRTGPGGDEIVHEETFVGTPSSPHVYAGTQPYGIEPGEYGFRLTAFIDGRSSSAVSPGRAVVEVPGMPVTLLRCAAVGADVVLSWGVVWPGYSCLEVRAVDRANPDLSFVEFLAPDVRFHVFSGLPFGDFEFSLRGQYKEGFLPASIASHGAPSTCSASLAPALRMESVETGVGLAHKVFIPIRADLPAPATGFSCTVNLPSFVELASDSGFPQSASEAQDTFLLNDDPGTDEDLEIVLGGGPVEDNPNRKTLSIDVAGASFSAGADTVVGWLVGTIDWSSRDFDLWGEHRLQFEGDEASMTFAPGPETLDVTLRNIRLEDTRSRLLVHKRVLSVTVETPDRGDLSEPVPVRVHLTFDERQVLGFTLRLLWDPELLVLEPFDQEDLKQTAVEFYGFPGFSTDLAFDDARTTGELLLPWIGLFGGGPIDEAFLEPGIQITLAFLKFRVNVESNSPATVLPISLVIDPPDGGQSSDVFFNPRVSNDNWPEMSFFDGGIELGPQPDVPALIAVEPDHGSMAGGGTATLHGIQLDVAPEERSEVRLSLATELDDRHPALEANPLLGNLVVVNVPSGDILWDESTARALRFRVPSAPSALALPEVGAVPFNVRLEARGGRSTIENAFTYENLSVASANRAIGIADGGEEMVLRGTGLAESARVSFAIAAAGDPESFLVSEYLDHQPGDRSLKFLTPRMEVDGDTLATVKVTVPGLGESELPVKFLIKSTAIIRSVTPDNGRLAGGYPVKIEVAGFDTLDPATVEVFFGESQAMVEGVERTETDVVDVIAPPGGELGPVGIIVRSGSDEAIRAESFTYTPDDPARIVSIDPSQGPIEGGNTVEVVVENFEFADDDQDYIVLFGSEQADLVTEVAAGVLEVTVPAAMERGPVDVTVRRGDLVSERVAETPRYRYVDPEVRDVELPSGPTTGGNEVTIVVVDFGAVTDSAVVLFGDQQAQVLEATVLDDEDDVDALRVVVPSECQIVTVDVRVTMPESSVTAVKEGGYSYRRDENIALSGADPTHVSGCGGEIITVTGLGFCSGMTLSYGETAVEFTIVDGHTIRFTAPATPETVESVELAISLGGIDEFRTIPITVGARFVRGDLDENGVLDTTDIALLSRFLAGSSRDFQNLDALDVNDDGVLNAGDLMVLTTFAFEGGTQPPPPFPEPGVDPTADDLPRCLSN